jgi:hypothetical protein
MKRKLVFVLLCAMLTGSTASVFAEEDINASEAVDESESESESIAESVDKESLVPIDGLDGCYIQSNPYYQFITDENGNKLIDMNFRKVDTSLGIGDTLIVWYPEGMEDSSVGVLSKDLKVIVPKNFYRNPKFLESNGKIYIAVESVMGGGTDYYDLEGNKVDKPSESTPVQAVDKTCSDWASESIKKAVDINLVPAELQNTYTAKITRAEFCRLAVQTYIAKTGYEIDTAVKTPFTDADDCYIITAYNLGIVAGVGNNKFAPDNNITRQEAAVMLNNLATVLNVDNTSKKADLFVDESYFANWAKAAIYSVSAIKSGDTYVMAGTGNGKFSPWMNYTREQAIATMLRLFNC